MNMFCIINVSFGQMPVAIWQVFFSKVYNEQRNLKDMLWFRESGQPATCFKDNIYFISQTVSNCIWKYEVLGEKTTLQFNHVIQ